MLVEVGVVFLLLFLPREEVKYTTKTNTAGILMYERHVTGYCSIRYGHLWLY